MSKTRNILTIKLTDFSEADYEKVNEWANEQKSIQQSVVNLIRHASNYAGNRDVMDFDVQRKLHTFFSVLEEGQAAVSVPVVDVQKCESTKIQEQPKQEETKDVIASVHEDAGIVFD